MATRKDPDTGEEREVDPEPVIEPPPTTSTMAAGSRATENPMIVTAAGTVTLPSGGTYTLSPGTRMVTNSEDAKWLAQNGYATEES